MHLHRLHRSGSAPVHFVIMSVLQDLPVNFGVEVYFMINFVLIKTFDKDSCLLLIVIKC